MPGHSFFRRFTRRRRQGNSSVIGIGFEQDPGWNNAYSPGWPAFVRTNPLEGSIHFPSTDSMYMHNDSSFYSDYGGGPLSYEAMLSMDENNVKRGVKPKVLDRLSQGKVGPDNASKDCPICMEVFPEGSKVMTLPCSHVFCDGCIRQWLREHSTCPTCRYRFPDSQVHTVQPIPAPRGTAQPVH